MAEAELDPAGDARSGDGLVRRPESCRWVGRLPRRGRAVVEDDEVGRRVVAWLLARPRTPPRGAGVVRNSTLAYAWVLLMKDGKVGLGLATFRA